MKNCAVIDLDMLHENAVKLRDHVRGVPVCAVVKADAYGHGAVRIAHELVNAGIEYFSVAFTQEGAELRANGLTAPVLVLLHGTEEDLKSAVERDLEITVCSLRQADAVAEISKTFGKKAKVHIFIDTGMQRGGLYWKDAGSEIEKILNVGSIEVKGIYTHCAAADFKDLTFTYTQLERFDSVADTFSQAIPFKHAAGSNALLQVPESYYNLVRPGISLYGYWNTPEFDKKFPLKPVMSVKSYIADVRMYYAPEGIGYSLTYKVDTPTRIASIPIGYGDGVNRMLSNRGSVLIQGKRFPIAGIVAMDWIMVDVGDNEPVRAGDEVMLIGKQDGREISIYEWCDILQTIPYEVMCNFRGRLQRCYVQHER